MEKYSLVVESGADLPKKVIEKYGIKVVPMHIELNGHCGRYSIVCNADNWEGTHVFLT